MHFVVPVLEPHLYSDYNFGACKIAAAIDDPGGVPGTGVVYLRGAVRPDPMFKPTPSPSGLVPCFTLPAGMRPAADRWFSCQTSSYLGLFNNAPGFCLVRAGGLVEIRGDFSVDGAIFFDGIWFIAER
jgi:hypothetical protein